MDIVPALQRFAHRPHTDQKDTGVFRLSDGEYDRFGHVFGIQHFFQVRITWRASGPKSEVGMHATGRNIADFHSLLPGFVIQRLGKSVLGELRRVVHRFPWQPF